MRKVLFGLLGGVAIAFSVAAGFIPLGANGGFQTLFSPKEFDSRVSTKARIQLNVSDLAAIRVKPTANSTMYLNYTAAGTGLALAANTEYTFGIAPGITHVSFYNASTAGTTYTIQKQ